MTCIITGAVAFNGAAWVGGDLHQIGTAYVFNCCMHQENGEPLWAERESWSHYSREIDFSASAQYFERRGVIVASAAGTALNDAAKEYVRG
jgi:hypothetical protein